MKTKYEALKRQLKDACLRFEEVMKEPKNDIVRDAAIQRFEFTFELVWKTLKAYLEERGARDIYFPKDAIRGAFSAGIIDDDPRWFEMIKTRNLTSHVYNEDMAEGVYNELANYLPLIKNLIKEIE